MITSNAYYRFAQLLTILIIPAGLAALWFVKIEDRVRVSGVVTSPRQATATSPIKETVVDTVHVKIGDVVSAGDPLVTLKDLAGLHNQSERLGRGIARMDTQRAALQVNSASPAAQVVELTQETARLAELSARKKLLDLPQSTSRETIPSTFHAAIVEKRQLEVHLRSELARAKELVQKQLRPKQSVEKLTHELQQAGIQRRLSELALKEERDAVERQIAVSHRKITELTEVIRREVDRIAHERSEATQSLAHLQREMARLTVGAPFDGLVVDVPVKESQAVQVGSALVEISGSNAKIIETRVPESRMLEVKKGQPVIIKSALYNFLKYDVYHGVVSHVAPHGVLEGDRVLYDVTITIDEGDDILSVGSAARCEILVGSQPAINLLIRRR